LWVALVYGLFQPINKAIKNSQPNQAFNKEEQKAQEPYFLQPLFKSRPIHAAKINKEKQLALGELELIKPELWFRNCPEAANRLAEVVYKFILSNNQ